MTRKRIVVMGFMAGCPIAGVVWQHIHYIVGLQRLGHDVYYIEDSARLPYNPVTYEMNEDCAYAVETLRRISVQFGFEDRWAYCPRYLPDADPIGCSRGKLLELYRHSDAILNVCGSQEFNEDLLQSERILYVESDPGVEQIKVDAGNSEAADYLQRHHALFTFGENIGSPAFPVPTGKFTWLPTRQPVVTDFWKTTDAPPSEAVFTSVANWSTSGKKDITWQGERYLWSKSLEFLRFIEAPRLAEETFELATNIPEADVRARFAENSWRFTSPDPLSIDHDLYRAYLQGSKGEFTVAKDQYVRLHTGWFSDRTACYLAAGRPVITQQTGFTAHYGNSGGLFAFETMEEAVDAVKAINAEPRRHSQAAYEVAVEHFEATKVLSSLLDRAGI